MLYLVSLLYPVILIYKGFVSMILFSVVSTDVYIWWLLFLYILPGIQQQVSHFSLRYENFMN